MLDKAVLVQTAGGVYWDVLSAFCYSIARHEYFDKIYIASPYKDTPLRVHPDIRRYLERKLGTNFTGEMDSFSTKVRFIQLDKDRQFIENIKIALDAIPEDIFLLDVEDHILLGADWEKMNQAFNFMESNQDAGYLRLTKVKPSDSENFISVQKDSHKYRISLRPSLWRKNFLRASLMCPGIDIWDFERQGSEDKQTKGKGSHTERVVQETGLLLYSVNTPIWFHQDWIHRGVPTKEVLSILGDI